jgi:hypothetical protein
VPLVTSLRDVLARLVVPRRKKTQPAAEPAYRGQSGPHATIDITDDVGKVTMAYNPDTDGDPDPGEVIWTWVPYEDDPTRGKDRPVLLVARAHNTTFLGVQLSSQDHSDDPEWVAVGSGGWDSGNRASWADLTRVLRVHAAGMRREGAALARDQYDEVAAALRERYGWKLRT